MTTKEKEMLRNLFEALLKAGLTKIIPDIREGLLFKVDSDEDERGFMEILLLNVDLLNDTDVREVLHKVFPRFRKYNYSKNDLDVVADTRKILTNNKEKQND